MENDPREFCPYESQISSLRRLISHMKTGAVPFASLAMAYHCIQPGSAMIVRALPAEDFKVFNQFVVQAGMVATGEREHPMYESVIDDVERRLSVLAKVRQREVMKKF